MSYLIANPEDRFSCDEAYMIFTFANDLDEPFWTTGFID